MQCTHGNCRDFTLKRRRSRSVGAERLLDAHALRLASSTAGAEAGALFGPCAASELYGDEVKQRFSGGRLHGWSRAKQIKAMHSGPVLCGEPSRCAMRLCSDASRGLRCACLSRTRGGRDCLRNGLR